MDKPVANMAEHSPKLAAALKVLVRKLEAMPEPLRGPFLVEGLAPYSQSELSRLSAENAELRKEIDRRDKSFDLRWKSDMRAIERWHEATGRTMVLPDHTDLSVWLFGQLEAIEARLSEAAEVLKPFAEIAPLVETTNRRDGERVHEQRRPDGTWHTLTRADFRAARQFLDTQGGGNG